MPERFKVTFQFVNRVIEIDMVCLEEGMHFHPRPEIEQTSYLRFGQTFASVSLQRQDFKNGAREIRLLALNAPCKIVRDFQVHVHRIPFH